MQGLSRVCNASDPILLLDGVIPATRNALKKSNLNLNDIDLFEVNDAFDWDKVNINDDACAYGHLLSATSAILMTKLVDDLEYNEKKIWITNNVYWFGIWLLPQRSNLSQRSKYCNFKFVELKLNCRLNWIRICTLIKFVHVFRIIVFIKSSSETKK